jgi:hypothetical protein
MFYRARLGKWTSEELRHRTWRVTKYEMNSLVRPFVTCMHCPLTACLIAGGSLDAACMHAYSGWVQQGSAKLEGKWIFASREQYLQSLSNPTVSNRDKASHLHPGASASASPAPPPLPPQLLFLRIPPHLCVPCSFCSAGWASSAVGEGAGAAADHPRAGLLATAEDGEPVQARRRSTAAIAGIYSPARCAPFHPPRDGRREVLVAGLAPPPCARSFILSRSASLAPPSPSPADAFEERGDAILHLLSPRMQTAFHNCLLYWRSCIARTVATGEAKLLLPPLLDSVSHSHALKCSQPAAACCMHACSYALKCSLPLHASMHANAPGKCSFKTPF